MLAVFLPVASCVQNDICQKYLHFAGCLLNLILWLQELVTLTDKARGNAGTIMDCVDSYLGSSSTEDLSMVKLTDQEENLLQQFLSPKVCQPPSIQEAVVCYALRNGQWHWLEKQNMLGMLQCGLHHTTLVH